MDNLLVRIQRVHDRCVKEQRAKSKALAHREVLANLCKTVAGWSLDSVLAFNTQSVEVTDVVVPLAWALRELGRHVDRSGLGGRLRRLAAKGDPDQEVRLRLGVAGHAGEGG